MEQYDYKIEQRPDELGGGWRLRLLEDGEEVGGGVFPLDEYLEDMPGENEALERRLAMQCAHYDAESAGNDWIDTRRYGPAPE